CYVFASFEELEVGRNGLNAVPFGFMDFVEKPPHFGLPQHGRVIKLREYGWFQRLGFQRFIENFNCKQLGFNECKKRVETGTEAHLQDGYTWLVFKYILQPRIYEYMLRFGNGPEP